MKLALLSYTNVTSGCGVVAAALHKWLHVGSILSVASIKGQELWTDRQMNVNHVTVDVLAEFIADYHPDWIISVETAFNNPVVTQTCRALGVRTANLVMHESYRDGADDFDLFICPTRIAYDKVAAPNKVFFDLPFDIDGFKFKARKAARRFLHVMGYGASWNRRQTREVIDGFLISCLPDSTLTVHCQQSAQHEYGGCDDPRVTFRLATLPAPADVYADHDVLVQPDSYAGFNLPLLEAKACGLPVITTDAPPMNELVRDPDGLISVERERWLDPTKGTRHGLNVYQNIVSARGVADAMQRVAATDIEAKSKRARECAEAHAWTEDKAADLLRLLEGSL